MDVQNDRIPLWVKGTTLYWRFDEKAMSRHEAPEALKREVRRLLQEAIEAWGTTPVEFRESSRGWDFEIAVLRRKDCDDQGCTLASAFFPDGARQRMLIYPSMFDFDRRDQVMTLAHELGHVFGLRHYFADTDEAEKRFPSLVFGKHSSSTIMNYGDKSVLTKADRNDLMSLYRLAWSADAEEQIGREVRMVESHHAMQT